MLKKLISNISNRIHERGVHRGMYSLDPRHYRENGRRVNTRFTASCRFRESFRFPGMGLRVYMFKFSWFW